MSCTRVIVDRLDFQDKVGIAAWIVLAVDMEEGIVADDFHLRRVPIAHLEVHTDRAGASSVLSVPENHGGPVCMSSAMDDQCKVATASLRRPARRLACLILALALVGNGFDGGGLGQGCAGQSQSRCSHRGPVLPMCRVFALVGDPGGAGLGLVRRHLIRPGAIPHQNRGLQAAAADE